VKAVVIVVVALMLGGAIGVLVKRDPGYVLVAYDQSAIETSLWFALLVLIAGYFALRLLIFLTVRVLRGRSDLAGWNARRRARLADRRTAEGLMLLAEGQWDAARKRLVRAVPRASEPLLNLLAAARAANETGAAGIRDQLLRRAREAAGPMDVAVLFTEAELRHAAGDDYGCVEALRRLRERAPAHAAGLRLLARSYANTHAWRSIVDLLPELRRRHALPDAELEALERRAWCGRLEDPEERPETIWADVPKALRRAPAVAAAYARAEAARSRPDDAARAIRDALNHAWDAGLVRLYGEIPMSDPARQLSVAEGWLKAHPDDAALFLTLGRLSLRNEKWSQAREHFEMSVRLAPTAEAHAELGRLAAAQGEPRATEHFLAAFHGLPDLPLPERAAGRVAGRPAG
jgi:HemY protein